VRTHKKSAVSEVNQRAAGRRSVLRVSSVRGPCAVPAGARARARGSSRRRNAGSRASSARRRAARASCPVFAPSSFFVRKLRYTGRAAHATPRRRQAQPRLQPPRTSAAPGRPATAATPARPRAPHLQRPWCVDAVHSHITTASKDVPAYSRRKQRAALRDYCEPGGLEKGVLSAQVRSRRCRVWPAGQCQAAKTLCDRSYLAHPHR
jgi:hypothetical protein